MAAPEEAEFIRSRLKQRKFDQGSSQRHWRALDGSRHLTSFLHRLRRVAQVVKGQLDVLWIERPLEDLAVHLEEGGPDWFGLLQHSTDRPLDGITFYRALDSH